MPKTDTTVLPCWVNDYWVLNMNMDLDTHPLPPVDDSLADCVKGKIWSKLDMTNSFFQTCIHPDDIHTSHGHHNALWPLQMASHAHGLWNSPPIHQHCMTIVLMHLLGKICHIYLDNIIIWSDNIEQHTKHIHLVLTALWDCQIVL